MAEPIYPPEHTDRAVAPFLPTIGVIAVESARLEWALSALASTVLDRPLKKTLRMSNGDKVEAVEQALETVTATDRRRWAEQITTWATTAGRLLAQRGDLMHSHWITGDVPTSDDLIRSGKLTAQQAQSADPTEFINVYSQRLRSTEPPIMRTVTDLDEFARSLRDHAAMYWPTLLAVGHLLGLWSAREQ